MPVAFALLLAAADGSPLLLRAAVDRIGNRCSEPSCAPPSRFRLDREAGGGATMKDRAMRDDGSYCNVVGARRCTSGGRTVFSTGGGE